MLLEKGPLSGGRVGAWAKTLELFFGKALGWES